jgi:diguanylate cyclase (GGDEF)-like protein/PAS domain S-box-containing protein
LNILDSHIFTIIAITLLVVLALAAVIFGFFFFKKKEVLSSFLKNKVKHSLTKDVIPFKKPDHHQEHAYKLLPEAIVILNAKNQIIYLNVEAENMLDCKLRSVMGKQHSDVFRLLNRETRRVMQGLLDNKNGQENIKRDCLLSTQMDQIFSIELNVIHSYNSDEKRKILVLRDITEREALETKLSNLETYDSLTRMLNRKAFDAEVKQLIDNAHKHDAKHVLAYFSIDQFQVINDTIGYTSSDNLVLSMAGTIKNFTNKSIDIVGRVAANEFAVVFSDRKLSDAMKAIQGILKDVSEFEFLSRGQQYSLTMSAGFMVVDVETTSSTRAISEANIACNLAGKLGGNKVFAYRAENTEIQKLEGNLEWVLILKNALQENRFRMHAQAIHPLKLEEYKKPFHHYECLIRLSDEKGNPISPAEFIAAAEYYSMMPRLDRWVLTNVFKHISVLPDQSPLPIFAINLSGQSLNDPQFLTFVKQEIKDSGVHPQMLCFEITEQVAVEDLNAINNFISSLKALGCRFSLDDFGTGVSSFGYLRSLNVDYLKIDGSFVKHIASDDVAKTMVQSINQVGHTMDLKIIAEYVENEEIVEILREMGVDYGQGYQIAKPIPIEDIIARHINDDKAVLKIVN